MDSRLQEAEGLIDFYRCETEDQRVPKGPPSRNPWYILGEQNSSKGESNPGSSTGGVNRKRPGRGKGKPKKNQQCLDKYGKSVGGQVSHSWELRRVLFGLRV